ncbi:putative arsenate reductase [Gordonia paraffinivorans NBRC 108238]|uniref:Arsenate reductase n=1 Tax=Gordonia paraffinivorans NBRC 108238 TaxID=1223543 RepID=A0ABQ0IQI8_9ACTN|nr:low molecular weight phosphatase family protein [Gordonia paraffinivorans]GAC85813.1 putative arsenate reductase [Gordonia paraffinivorans NBRC 108238]
MSENVLDEQLSRGEHRAQPELLMPHTVLARTAADLAAKYEGVVSRQTVERCVFESYTALRRTSRVHAHLTTLAGRFAADRLRALAQAEGAVPKDVPEVLFICVQNAGRSQMAAGLMTHHATGRVHVRSAGLVPAHSINTTVVEAMSEIGVDLGTEYPKPLTDDVVAAADVVVSMGCGDACPIYPGKRYLDWTVSDPEGRSLGEVRAIRDDLDARVRELLAELMANHV